MSLDSLKHDVQRAIADEDYVRAIELLESAKVAATAGGDAALLCDHARALHAAGRISEAIEKTEQALQAVGDDVDARAEALRIRANARIVQRQFAGAEADLREVVTICRDRKDAKAALPALRSLSSALAGMGRVADASSHLVEAAEVCRRIGGTHTEARVQAIEGYRAFIENRYPDAKAHFLAALEVDAEGDSVDATVPYLLARTCMFTGDLEEAARRFRELADDYGRRGARLSEACMVLYQGEVALELEDLASAETHAVRAEEMLVAEGLDAQEDLYLRRVRALRSVVAAERGEANAAQTLIDAARPGPEIDFGLIGRWPRTAIWRRIGRSHQALGERAEAEAGTPSACSSAPPAALPEGRQSYEPVQPAARERCPQRAPRLPQSHAELAPASSHSCRREAEPLRQRVSLR